MKLSKLICAVTAVLTACSLCFSIGCGRKPHYEEVIIEAGLNTNPTETAEAGPTEPAEPTDEPIHHTGVSDAKSIEGALQRVCDLIEDPSLEHLKALYPEDYFNGIEEMLGKTLGEAGLEYENLGYESFDEIILAALGSLDFARALNIKGLDNVEKAVYHVNSTAHADTAEVVDALKLQIEYMDAAKITSAYRLNVDFTVTGDGTGRISNTDVTVYEYDGEFFVLFA